MYIRTTNQPIYATIQLYQDDEGNLEGGLVPNFWNAETIEDLLSFDGSPTYNPVISLDSPIFDPIRHTLGSSINIQVSLAPITIEDDEQVQTSLELKTMSRIFSFTALIRDQEELETQFQHGQNLYECRSVTSYKGQLVLYDNPNASTVLYMSDMGGNITYFPFRRALDQFYSDIIHVQPVQQGLIVFTSNDIYLVYEEIDIDDNVIFKAQVIYANLTVKPHNRNTVRAVGKDIVFLANDNVLMLRPNPYVSDITDMFLENISRGVKEIFEDPREYIEERLAMYEDPIDLDEHPPTIEYYTVIKNEEFWIHMSVHIPDHDPLMLIAIHKRSQRPFYWKLYDTRAMSFPYNHAVLNTVEGTYSLMRNHKTIDGGVTLMLTEALNLDDFAEDYGNLFDIQTLKVDGEEFIYNSENLPELEEFMTDPEYQKIKHPIRPGLDTGFMDITSHLNKRFHRFHLEFHNIDCFKVPIYGIFNIDGIDRQTSETLQMIVENETMQQVKTLEPLYELGDSLLNLWELGFSMFEGIKKYKINIGISGRGRLPQMKLGFKTVGKFKLYRYGIIFKEQTSK